MSIKGQILAILIGLLLAVVGGHFFFEQRALINNAEETTGKVLSKSVDVDSEVDETYYHPKVKYVYTVGENEYKNNEIKPGGRSYSSSFDAEDVMDEYEKGEEVTVYYNPEESFLKKESSLLLLVITVTGVITVIVSGGILVVAFVF